MLIFWGIIFHFKGGFAFGSFYIPYKKVTGWACQEDFSWLIVPDMHAAYYTIEFSTHSYGVFIAGPSKMADIE